MASRQTVLTTTIVLIAALGCWGQDAAQVSLELRRLREALRILTVAASRPLQLSIIGRLQVRNLLDWELVAGKK